MKKLLCLMMIVLLVSSLSACTRYYADNQKYLDFARENEVMPDDADLGGYTGFHTLVYPYMGLDNYSLIACYDDEHYTAQKKKVQERYTFETEAQYDHIESNLLDPQFTLGEFEFCMLDVEKYNCHLPQAYFIGFNDRKNQIAFVYFADKSLDVVYSYEDILIDKCGWDTALLYTDEFVIFPTEE